MRGALQQSHPHQQIHIGVEGAHKHQRGSAEAAHLRQHPPLQPERRAQPGLGRPAELQIVGIGVGHHISGHCQGQEQGPLPLLAPPEVKQGHGAGAGGAHHGHPQRHHHAQHYRGERIPAKHRARHFAQQRRALGIPLQHGDHQSQNRQGHQPPDQPQRQMGRQCTDTGRERGQKAGGHRQLGRVKALRGTP